MSSFLRFSLLAMCAAAGVSVAICLALHTPPPEHDAPPIVTPPANNREVAPADSAVAPQQPVAPVILQGQAAEAANSRADEKPMPVVEKATVVKLRDPAEVTTTAPSTPQPSPPTPLPPVPSPPPSVAVDASSGGAQFGPVWALPDPAVTQKVGAPPRVAPRPIPPAATSPGPAANTTDGSVQNRGAPDIKSLISPELQRQLQDALRAAETSQAKAGPIDDPFSTPKSPEELPSKAGAPKPSGDTAAERPAKKPTITKIVKPQAVRMPGEGDDRLSINIQNNDIRDVLEMLAEQGGLNILPSGSVQGKVTASLNDVNLQTALEVILRTTGFTSRRDGKFIYVGTPQDFQNIERALDRVGTRIYRPNYVKASDLQALITPLLTQGVGMISVSVAAEVGIVADATKTGGDSFAGNEALLVKDYEAVLVQCDQIVHELDKRPTQVAIEAMVLSVSLNDENSLGVDFQFLRDKKHIKLATGSPATDLAQVTFADGGLKFGFLDSSLGAFLNALETIGKTDVIATPRLMCVNKHRAEILIGSQLGYISSTVTETSTAQSVQFLEVGTQLRIRPFISSDGTIRMEVHPELSTGSVEVKNNFTLPQKDVTQVTTNVMTRDGCTVIIGGLMRDDLDTTTTQVPLLGSLPGVGFLFRHKKDTQVKREVLVLITPHIVYEPDSAIEGHRAAADFHDRHANYADHMSPIGFEYLSRKYRRLAEEALARKDIPAATHFIDLAIHFDPQSRAALEVRERIMRGGNGDPPPGVLPVAGPLDGEHIAPWLLDDLEYGGNLPPPPEHPYDPGLPGHVKDIERPTHLQ